MRLRALRDACAGGFVYGAVVYGAALSLLHVVHNRLGSSRDALIALQGFVNGGRPADALSGHRPAGRFYSAPTSRFRSLVELGSAPCNPLGHDVLWLGSFSLPQSSSSPG